MQSNEVLIQVAAFGVGIHDRYFIPGNVPFPYVIGSEGAGTIVKKGADVTGVSEGDRVIFTTILQPQGGSWAAYAEANAITLIPLPEALSFAQGAAVPIAGKTGLECVRELSLKTGDTLFIAGASGAIGTLVIQLAKQKGARIAASASAKNHDYMKELGADLTVDYNDPNWMQQVRDWSGTGVNVALAIQPGTGTDSIKTVRDGGLLITVSGDSQQVEPERGVTIRQMGHAPETQASVTQLVADIAAGRIKLVIEQEYPFEQVLDALQKTETRHARGKLVVNVHQ